MREGGRKKGMETSCTEDWGWGGLQKVGPYKMDCVGGVWGTPPGNFEILYALKCVLGAPEALFHACTQYIYTCKLPSLISGSD